MKISTFSISVLTATTLCFANANSSFAQTEDVDYLNSLLDGIETLSADVLQLIVESDGGVLEESEIKMFLKKPDGFFWETLSPFPELIVTDGQKLWNYQPDLEQVVIEDWDSGRSELAAQLLNGQTQNLADEYSIEVVSPEDSEHQEFKLVPFSANSIYQQISINFMRTELDTIHLDNKNGQQTVWRFENVTRNLELEDSLFIFMPPAGIEIIENNYVQ